VETALQQKPKSQIETVKDLFTSVMPQIRDVLPKHMTADRLMRVMTAAVSRNPKLMKCTPASLMQCFMDCGKLGFEPTGEYGGAHLVPFLNGKTNRYEAQFIVDYRGLIQLARRSQEIKSIHAHCVYENDVFSVRYGDDEVLEHVPQLKGQRGRMIFVYAIAHLRDGGIQRVVLSKEEVDGYRARSRAKDSGPWVTDYFQMAKKTALRRLCNLLPRSVEYMTRIEEEDRYGHDGMGEAPPTIIDVPVMPDEDEEPEPQSEPPQLTQLKGAIKQTLDQRPEAQPEPAPSSTAQPDMFSPPLASPAPTPERPPEQEEGAMDAAKKAFKECQDEVIRLVGEERAKQLWDSETGPGSLRGVRNIDTARQKLAAAIDLMERLQLGVQLNAVKKSGRETPRGEEPIFAPLENPENYEVTDLRAMLADVQRACDFARQG